MYTARAFNRLADTLFMPTLCSRDYLSMLELVLVLS